MLNIFLKYSKISLASIILLMLAACVGGGEDEGESANGADNEDIGTLNASAFNVEGTVSGLSSGQKVVLQLNDGSELEVGDAPFVFEQKVDNESTYLVTVKDQPTSKLCTVVNGIGKIKSNNAQVSINCQDGQRVTPESVGIKDFVLMDESNYIIQGSKIEGAAVLAHVNASENTNLEYSVQQGIVNEIIKSDGQLKYKFSTNELQPGSYPYTIKIFDRNTKDYALISGAVVVVAEKESHTASISSNGAEVVLEDGKSIKFSANQTTAPIAVKISVADSPEGNIYNFDFERDVAGAGIVISLPEADPAYDPYNGLEPPSSGILPQLKNLGREVASAMSAFVAAMTGEVATVDAEPYDEETSVIDNKVKPIIEKEGLGQLVLQGQKQPFSRKLMVNARLWEPKKHLGFGSKFTVATYPAYELHAAIRGNIDNFDWGNYEPVLFVHGFNIKSIGGGKDSWEKFPKLAMQTPLNNGSNLVAFEFHWRTNQSFRTAADDLAEAINFIHKKSGKKVRIVAHSFGGILSTTLLQKQSKNKTDINEKVAALMTLGSPHSGIFDKDEKIDNIDVPNGQDSMQFEGCVQISCHEMGEHVSFSETEDEDFGLTVNENGENYQTAGRHALVLNKTRSQLPVIPIHVGIGLMVEKSTQLAKEGDELISFAGQRFNMKSRAESISSPLLGNDKLNDSIIETILGLPPDSRPGEIVELEKLPTSRVGGYKHTGVVTKDAGLIRDVGLEAAPFSDCDNRLTCTHAGYVLFREMIRDELYWNNIQLKDAKQLPPERLTVKAPDKWTPSQLAAIEKTLALAVNKNIIIGQFIDWSKLSTQERENALGGLASIEDTATVQALKADYAQQFAVLSEFRDNKIVKMNRSISLKNVFWNEQAAQEWSAITLNSIQAVMGVLKVAYPYAGIAADSGKRAVNIGDKARRALKYMKALDKSGKILDLLTSCADPTLLADYKRVRAEVESGDINEENFSLSILIPLECAGAIVSGADQKPASVLVAVLTSSVEVEDEERISMLQALVEVTNAGLSSIPSGSAAMQRARGLLDVTSAAFDAYSIGVEMAKRSDKNFIIEQEKIFAVHDLLIATLSEQRTLQVLRAKTGDLYKIDPSFAKISVTPEKPTLLEEFKLLISEAWSRVKSVIVNFGTTVTDLFLNINESTASASVNHIYDIAGSKTITLTYMDQKGGEGNVIGSSSFDFDVLETAPEPENGTAVLEDNFNGSELNADVWNVKGTTNCGGHQVSGGYVTFYGGSYADTQGKKVFSGSKIVVQARMAGTSGNRSTVFALVDSETGDYIMFGDTNYSATAAPGIHLLGIGAYATDKRGLDASTNLFRDYRMTVQGTRVLLEWGDANTGNLKTRSFDLPNTTAGRRFYLLISTGASDCYYSPGTFDSIQVQTIQSAKKLNPDNGHSYEVIDCGTWSQCRAKAQSLGGELVTIRSRAEQDWLIANFGELRKKEYGFWIGLTDEASEGEWRWASGEPVSFTAWLPGEPNSGSGLGTMDEDHAHLWWYFGSVGWNDAIQEQMGNITQAIVEYTSSIPQTMVGTLTVQATDYPGSLLTNPLDRAVTCDIMATGQWRLAPWIEAVDADGYATDNAAQVHAGVAVGTFGYAVIPTANGGTLVLQRSPSQAESIGKSKRITLAARESVRLLTNDVPWPVSGFTTNAFVDNSGEMTVSYKCQ